MWERLKIADTLVEYDAAATREAYIKDDGGINSCTCEYCANYRLVRNEVYPADFRKLLSQLGIDYRKEVELEHLTEDDSGDARPYGHSVSGHYAFVGRVLETEGNAATTDASRFGYGVSSGNQVHPVTSARFGHSPQFIDLNFWVPHVPEAEGVRRG